MLFLEERFTRLIFIGLAMTYVPQLLSSRPFMLLSFDTHLFMMPATLPHELWFMVVNFVPHSALPNLSLTSSFFYAVCSSPLKSQIFIPFGSLTWLEIQAYLATFLDYRELAKDITVVADQRFLNIDTVIKLLRLFRSAQSLNIRGGHLSTLQTLPDAEAFDYPPILEYLHLLLQVPVSPIFRVKLPHLSCVLLTNVSLLEFQPMNGFRRLSLTKNNAEVTFDSPQFTGNTAPIISSLQQVHFEAVAARSTRWVNRLLSRNTPSLTEVSMRLSTHPDDGAYEARLCYITADIL